MVKETNTTDRSQHQYLSGLGHYGDQVVTADLSLNENPLGASPKVIKAIRRSSNQIAKYPDGTHALLKAAISSRFHIDPSRLACGAGIDELLMILTRTLAGNRDEIVFPRYSFLMFQINALRVGAKPIVVGASEGAPSPSDICSSITPRTRLILIASPNNPTGSYISKQDVRRIAEALPSNVYIVLDGAYSEYVDDVRYSDGLDLLDDFPNLIVLRTFSKIYGLASLRVGWCAAGPDVIDKIEIARGPYNLSGLGQIAAVAALGDEDHVRRSREHVIQWRTKLQEFLQEVGIATLPSGANFILTKFADREISDEAYRHLRTSGILTRRLHDYGLSDCIRITVGTDADNELLIKSLSQFMPRSKFRKRGPRRLS